MKKILSFQDYILVGYFLKVAHISTLKASTLLANKDGKSKKPFQELKKLNEDLLRLRCDLENKLYVDYSHTNDEPQFRQHYLGKLNRKLQLIFNRENIFF